MKQNPVYRPIKLALINCITPVFFVLFIIKFIEYYGQTKTFEFWFYLIAIPFGLFMTVCQTIVIFRFGFGWPNKPEAKLF